MGLVRVPRPFFFSTWRIHICRIRCRYKSSYNWFLVVFNFSTPIFFLPQMHHHRHLTLEPSTKSSLSIRNYFLQLQHKQKAENTNPWQQLIGVSNRNRRILCMADNSLLLFVCLIGLFRTFIYSFWPKSKMPLTARHTHIAYTQQ